MRTFFVAIAVSAFMIVLACANPASNANSTASKAVVNALPGDDAPRITLDDAKKAFDDGTAIFIDARAEPAYKQEHIKGSINITSETLEAKYKELPKDKKIIVYCS